MIIDELGYLSFDASGASLLFQIFAARYETKSTLVTSNLEFSKWVTFLGQDEHMTAALIGRLIHQSVILKNKYDQLEIIPLVISYKGEQHSSYSITLQKASHET